jgi:hypothetical protein
MASPPTSRRSFRYACTSPKQIRRFYCLSCECDRYSITVHQASSFTSLPPNWKHDTHNRRRPDNAVLRGLTDDSKSDSLFRWFERFVQISFYFLERFWYHISSLHFFQLKDFDRAASRSMCTPVAWRGVWMPPSLTSTSELG